MRGNNIVRPCQPVVAALAICSARRLVEQHELRAVVEGSVLRLHQAKPFRGDRRCRRAAAAVVAHLDPSARRLAATRVDAVRTLGGRVGRRGAP
eukprot:5102407-Prymnesium_polylepis.4